MGRFWSRAEWGRFSGGTADAEANHPYHAAAVSGHLRIEPLWRYLRNVNSGHPGSITTVHADSAALAFEQLTLLVRESEGGRDLPREDIRALLHLLVDVVVQMKKSDGRFRITEVWHDPLRKRRSGD
ncbi:ATPase, T2SS/T4P/T4SS family [Brevundimonas sp.]|uniref:ATPase, T2SS/T4P/T4SS family n=1 Tax=Brevundimonas sp. TaxID=1871086 RepID=UPI0039E60F7E